MPKHTGSWFGAALLGLVLAQVAVAGPLNGDPAALLTGTASFSGNNDPFNILPPSADRFLLADVEYAVYAPGAFSTSGLAHLNFPADISGGTEYIYAYEVFNLGSLAVDARITSLSVGLFEFGVAQTASLISHLPDPLDPPGQVPSNWNFNPAANGTKFNAIWAFSLATHSIAKGYHSDILIFASPNPPAFKTSSMLGEFATADSELLPSPIPEPGTFLLAAMAAIGLLACGYLRRHGR